MAQQITTTNGVGDTLTIIVVSGVIQIAINGTPVYACSKEQSQQIVQFLREQFEKGQEATK
jgi:hypothetical protein